MQFANGLAVAFLSFGLKRLQMNAVDLLLIREEEKKIKIKRYPRLSIFKGHSIRYIKSKHSSTKAGYKFSNGQQID
jgi:hypothetical protein